MTRNAIARIIIYSVIILLLVGMLILVLKKELTPLHFDFPETEYFEGTGNAPAEQIKNIRIEWSSGDIQLSTGDVSEIIFSEEGYGAEEMVYRIDNETLVIMYAKPSLSMGISKKDLTVQIPKNWNGNSIILQVASADITANNLTANSMLVETASGRNEISGCIFNKMEIETASGECTFTGCDIGELDAESASGKIHYQGKLNKLDCDAASGDFVGVFTNVPDELSMDSASGDMDVTFPAEHSGFRVEMDAMSGKFRSDYPAGNYNGVYTYGDQHCKIEFDGASGSIIIRKP